MLHVNLVGLGKIEVIDHWRLSFVGSQLADVELGGLCAGVPQILRDGDQVNARFI